MQYSFSIRSESLNDCIILARERKPFRTYLCLASHTTVIATPPTRSTTSIVASTPLPTLPSLINIVALPIKVILLDLLPGNTADVPLALGGLEEEEVLVEVQFGVYFDGPNPPMRPEVTSLALQVLSSNHRYRIIQQNQVIRRTLTYRPFG